MKTLNSEFKNQKEWAKFAAAMNAENRALAYKLYDSMRDKDNKESAKKWFMSRGWEKKVQSKESKERRKYLKSRTCDILVNKKIAKMVNDPGFMNCRPENMLD